MKNLFAVVFSFIKNNVITQDFKLEGYSYFAPVLFTTSCDIWFKGLRPIIRYCGKEWENNRNEFMIELHGMTYEETQKEENAHLFVAKLSYKTV